MKDYDAYLFDWDGTLANSHAMWFALLRAQLKRYGIKANDMELSKKLLGRYLQGMQEFGVPEEDIPGLVKELDEASAKSYERVEMFPGAKELLVSLKKRNKKVAIITATVRKTVLIPLARHGLTEILDTIVTGDEMRAPKPDPDGIFKALERLDVRPDRAIMIGDSPKDLLAGKNAGVDTLLFYPPEHETQHSKDELLACMPTYTVRSWRELLDQLQ